MATDETITEVVEGIRLREEAQVEGARRTVWRVEQPSSPKGRALYDEEFMPLATVQLHHPAIDRYAYANHPITDEKITITITGQDRWSSAGPSLQAKAALGVAVALQEAASRALDIRAKLEPEVADQIKEREEKEKKRQEYQKKRAELRDQIAVITRKWVEETTEALKWYEGQGGRLKRKNKKGWDTFHELGPVNGNYITWLWSGQTFGDSITEVEKVEIRYESERSFDKVDIPKFPQKEIDEIRTKENALERVW